MPLPKEINVNTTKVIRVKYSHFGKNHTIIKTINK